MAGEVDSRGTGPAEGSDEEMPEVHSGRIRQARLQILVVFPIPANIKLALPLGMS